MIQDQNAPVIFNAASSTDLERVLIGPLLLVLLLVLLGLGVAAIAKYLRMRI